MSVLKVRETPSSPWQEINTIKGNDGKSAYQVAVEGGYTGTEAEFNSA